MAKKPISLWYGLVVHISILTRRGNFETKAGRWGWELICELVGQPFACVKFGSGFFSNEWLHLLVRYTHINIHLYIVHTTYYIFRSNYIDHFQCETENCQIFFRSEFSDRTKTFQKGWWSWGYHTNLSIDELPQSDFPFYRIEHCRKRILLFFQRADYPSLSRWLSDQQIRTLFEVMS